MRTTLDEETEMCDQNAKSAEAIPEERAARGKAHECGAGCPCEPRRCLLLAAVVLAAVAVPLAVRARKRSRRGKGEQGDGREAAGCCA